MDRFEVGSINGVTGSMVGSTNVGLFVEVLAVSDGLLSAVSFAGSGLGLSLAPGDDFDARLEVGSFDMDVLSVGTAS